VSNLLSWSWVRGPSVVCWGVMPASRKWCDGPTPRLAGGTLTCGSSGWTSPASQKYGRGARMSGQCNADDFTAPRAPFHSIALT